MKWLLLFTSSCTRIAVLVASVSLATAACAQNFTSFDPPNSTSTFPQGINAAGQITGYYFDPSGSHGFLRQANGTFITFDPPPITSPNQSVIAASINAQGEITGYYADSFGFFRGFLRHTDGTITTFEFSLSTASAARSPALLDFPSPGDDFFSDGTAAKAINLAGQITGVFGGAVAASRHLGFLRQPDGTGIIFNAAENNSNLIPFTQPQGINAVGEITGHYDNETGVHGFLRKTNGTIIRFDPLGSISTDPRGINKAGQIAGSYSVPTRAHGFLRKANGKIVTFDPPGSSTTQANAINRLGQISGYYLSADGTFHGFLRKKGGKIETFDAPGAGTGNSRGTFPQAIADGGKITGFYQGADSVVHGFVRSAR